MYRILHFFFYVSFSSMFGCASTQVTTSSSTAFNDDLTRYRVSTQVPALTQTNQVIETGVVELPAHQQNILIDELASKMVSKNEEFAKSTRVKGFKILIYSGRNIDQANLAVKDLKEKWTEEGEITYEQPNYKVKVGSYLTKLEAYSACVKLRKDFSSAIIVQENIRIPLDQLLGKGN